MTLKIDVTQLIDIAKEQNIPNAEEMVSVIETAVNDLADLVADYFEIQNHGAEHQSEAFGGLLASFGPSFDDQECPEEIRAADPSGDW